VLDKDDPNPIIEALEEDKIVNVVRGSMEYGSRALCHTSTLAMPDLDNVEYINDLNGRDTIMPMAPVMDQDQAGWMFEDKGRIFQSLEYMVCARDCKPDLPESMFGVTHVTPHSSIRTCRPQIIRHDTFMETILDQTGPIINTSFNEHGRPIVHDTNDVVRCHDFQVEHDFLGRVKTFVIKEQV
jgi:predicted NodU family carbamoyl transferase